MQVHNVIDSQELVEDIISKHGYAPEHNYWYMVNMGDESSEVLLWELNGNGIVFLKHDDGDIELISDILSPKQEQVDLFIKFLDFVHENYKVDEVLVTFDSKYRNDLINKVSDKYKVKAPRRTFTAPIFNMKNWDPNLGGKNWKKMRNMRNQFIKNHKPKITGPGPYTKQQLNQLIDQWAELDTSEIKNEWTKCFKNFVKNDFKGCEIVRIISVDNKPCSITAGWRIPNTNNYYSAIGVHNYKYKYLGETAYLDDFACIKLLKVDYVDMGGSDSKANLNFKLKFKPESLYTSYFMSVVKDINKHAQIQDNKGN